MVQGTQWGLFELVQDLYRLRVPKGQTHRLDWSQKGIGKTILGRWAHQYTPKLHKCIYSRPFLSQHLTQPNIHSPRRGLKASQRISRRLPLSNRIQWSVLLFAWEDGGLSVDQVEWILEIKIGCFQYRYDFVAFCTVGEPCYVLWAFFEEAE